MSSSSSMTTTPLILKLIAYFTLSLSIGLSVTALTVLTWTFDESQPDLSSSSVDYTMSQGSHKSKQISTESDITRDTDVDNVPQDIPSSPKRTHFVDVSQHVVRGEMGQKNSTSSTSNDEGTVDVAESLESAKPSEQGTNIGQGAVPEQVSPTDSTSSTSTSSLSKDESDVGAAELDKEDDDVVSVTSSEQQSVAGLGVEQDRSDGRPDPIMDVSEGVDDDTNAMVVAEPLQRLDASDSEPYSIETEEVLDTKDVDWGEIGTGPAVPSSTHEQVLSSLSRTGSIASSISNANNHHERPRNEGHHWTRKFPSIKRFWRRNVQDPVQAADNYFTSLGMELKDNAQALAEMPTDQLNVEILNDHVTVVRQTLSEWAPVWRQFPTFHTALVDASVYLHRAAVSFFQPLDEFENTLKEYSTRAEVDDESVQRLCVRVYQFLYRNVAFLSIISTPGGFWIPTHFPMDWAPQFVTAALDLRLLTLDETMQSKVKHDPPQVQMLRLDLDPVFYNCLWTILYDDSVTIGSRTYDLTTIRPQGLTPRLEEHYKSVGEKLKGIMRHLEKTFRSKLNPNLVYTHVRYLRWKVALCAPVWRQFPSVLPHLEDACRNLHKVVVRFFEPLFKFEKKLDDYCKQKKVKKEFLEDLCHQMEKYLAQYGMFRYRINTPGGLWIPTYADVKWKLPFETVPLDVGLLTLDAPQQSKVELDPPPLQMARLKADFVFQNRLWNIRKDDALTIGSSTHELTDIRPSGRFQLKNFIKV